MKGIGILCVAAVSVLAGCATSLAPGDDFNDWTQPTAYGSTREQRSVEVANQAAPASFAQASQPDRVHP